MRVIRACKFSGIKTVAVFSDADKNSLHVEMADEAINIGPAQALKSYLNAEAILAAARKTGADAVHPGYGFLSENAVFARLATDAGLKFIGPSPEALELMGNKANARDFVRKLGVPTVSGSEGVVRSVVEAHRIGRAIGFPLLVKASAGGGGRGMRVIRTAETLEEEFVAAQREARVTFGDDSVYLEQFVDRPRHVEVQVLGDGEGNVIALGERDCSLQRRNQKLVEEAPCVALSSAQREALLDSAVTIGQAVNYEGAGTVEFLVERDRLYFIEMNTRIQVEHPVTEWVTGLDLVREQLLIASGSRRIADLDPRVTGNAIECRINAEDPSLDFFPSPGTVQHLRLPGGPGVRVDTALFEGYNVTPYYDSLVAKVVVWGGSRAEALQRMRVALDEFSCTGVKTTAQYLANVMDHPNVRQGLVDTQFLARLSAEHSEI